MRISLLLTALLLCLSSWAQSRILPRDPYADNRVVRVYDGEVSDYAFDSSRTFWDCIDQKKLANMLSRAVRELSGQQKLRAGWRAILSGVSDTDLSQKKIAVKVNFNNTIQRLDTSLNNTPAMMIVLAKSLIQAGVKEETISFFDMSRPFPPLYAQQIRDSGLNRVGLFGNRDGLAESDKMIRIRDNAGYMREGKSTEFMPVPQLVVDADCLINLHLVKIHYPGVTAAMKNLTGLARNVGFFMHNKGVPDFTSAFQLADITLNEEIHRKSVLNIAEFIYGGHTPNTVDRFTNEDFFPDGRASSLILSRSPFYQDMVCYDFIRAEYLTADPNRMLPQYRKQGTDRWLRNAALCYPCWKFEHGEFVYRDDECPKGDLHYENIDYISVTLRTRKSNNP